MEEDQDKYIVFAWAWTRATPDWKLTLYQWAMGAIHSCVLVLFKNARTFMFWRIFSKFLAHFLQRSYSNY